jgi:formylmethanofuran dehydrogenase subunit B
MELLPCPFCGGVPDEITETHVIGLIYHFHHACKYAGGCSFMYGCRENVLAAWNTRAPTPTEAKLREALEEAAFLCAQLREHVKYALSQKDCFRAWNGHVVPPLSRLETLLAALAKTTTEEK